MSSSNGDLVQSVIPTAEQFALDPVGEAGLIGAVLALDVTNTRCSEAQWREIARRFSQIVHLLRDDTP